MSNKSSLWRLCQRNTAKDYELQCIHKKIKKDNARKKRERQNRRKGRK